MALPPGKGGTAATHGAPLGEDEVAAVCEELGWPHAPFVVPEEIRAAWDAIEKGRGELPGKKAGGIRGGISELAMELVRRIKGELPGEFSAKAEAYIQQC